MAYFLPYAFQRRLLRYALSRLELLDTDALDLDRLGITWGRKSTIELRGLAICKDKLSNLLKLPRDLVVTEARITVLRLTVPADLYRTGISVEVEDAELAITARKQDEGAQRTFKKPYPDAKSKAYPVEQHTLKSKYDENQSQVPGSFPSIQDRHTEEEEESSINLPTADELARSYLQTEAPDRRSELQSAVTQSQNLSRSNGSDASSPEESTLGVGLNLALPGFLSDFLKGVSERLTVEIKNITIDLHLESNQSLSEALKKTNFENLDGITLKIFVRHVSVAEVSKGSASNQSDDAYACSTSDPCRRISLRDIKGLVLSDDLGTWSSGQTASPSSPETTHADAAWCTSGASDVDLPQRRSSDQMVEGLDQSVAELRSTEVFNPTSSTSARSEPELYQGKSHDMEAAAIKETNTDSETSSDVFQSVFSEKRIGQDEFHPWNKGPSTPSRSVTTAWPNSPLPSQSLENREQSFSASKQIADRKIGNSSPQSPLGNFVSEGTRSSDDGSNIQCSNSSSERDIEGPETHQVPVQDLGESSIFSHEQATSMYLSAMGAGQSNASFSTRVPGSWEDPGHSEIGKSDGETSTGPFNWQRDRSPPAASDQQSTPDPYQGKSSEDSRMEGSYPPLDSSSSDDMYSPVRYISPSPLPNVDNLNVGAKSKSTRKPENATKLSPVWRKTFDIDEVHIEILTYGSKQLPPHQPLDTVSNDFLADFAKEESSRNLRNFQPGIQSDRTQVKDQTEKDVPTLQVEIGNVRIFHDISLLKLGGIIMQTIGSFKSSPPSPKFNQSSATEDPSQTNHKVSIRSLHWMFLDRVESLNVEDLIQAKTDSENLSVGLQSDILLQSRTINLQIYFRQMTSGFLLQGSLQKFCFGFQDDDIMSFCSDIKMKDSANDRLLPTDEDVLCTVTSSKRTLSVNITTLPLKVKLDLQRLDEAFTWFGGLSGLLELSNSIASNLSSLDAKMKPTRYPTQSRGVHFGDVEGSISSRDTAAGTMQHKITARFGGLNLDLVGAACLVQASSSAIKVVSRAEGVGLQVDYITLRGPHRADVNVRNHHRLDLSGMRVEFLANPKEVDLTRLLTLLAHSQKPNDRDDDIVIDTLLRQRKKGAVLRVTVNDAVLDISGTQDFRLFMILEEELRKLSTVAKYLPENDRPGLLTLGLVRSLKTRISLDAQIGAINLQSSAVEIAHVTFPAIVTLSIGGIRMFRGQQQELLGSVPIMRAEDHDEAPIISLRFIGNEMEPEVVVKMCKFRLEYHVDVLIACLGWSDQVHLDDMMADVADLASSIATLKEAKQGLQPLANSFSSKKGTQDRSSSEVLPLGIEIYIMDSLVGLNPQNSDAKAFLVLTTARISARAPKNGRLTTEVDIRKASVMITDDHKSNLPPEASPESLEKGPIASLEMTGFVTVARISAARVKLSVIQPKESPEAVLEIDLRNQLFVLETCADSTQTLGLLLNGLSPPTPKSATPKYRTEVVPVQDMLASFTGQRVTLDRGSSFSEDNIQHEFDEEDMVEDDVPQNLDFIASFYNPDPGELSESIADSMLDGDLESLAKPHVQREIGDRPVLGSFNEQIEIAPGNLPLDFREGHFGSGDDNSGKTPEVAARPKPFTLHAQDVHIIWNIYDGYDWQRTRDKINETAAEVEKEAIERLSRRENKKLVDLDDDAEGDVIGDYLFNSIYIGIPARSDPHDLTRQINANIDDATSETASTMTSEAARQPNHSKSATRHKHRVLRLTRSKHHKMTFELKGVSVNFTVFPPGEGEVESDLNLRVRDLEIFDHVPTSTWKKFATYMQDAGERETGSSMVSIQIQNVRPVANLSATEIVLKVSVLPLRLHVDQDALDFLSRFFEFKDTSSSPTVNKLEPPFVQRTEVKAIRVRLDFKPKRVDYAGIRSGRTNEFMNFFVLDGANMVLRHVIIYGVSGFDRLGKTLSDIWMPDVKRNQLPGVLAGLAPVRSLVNVGGGVRDLVAVPIREYRKDGRIVRSFQKGAVAFAKTTTSELMRLGAKLAIGTQTVLQGAEELLGPQSPRVQPEHLTSWEDDDFDEERNRRVSLYADQPVGVIQGLRGGYASLERDLLTAKDAIVAMPGEVLESGNAGEVARAVWKGAPTVILRPAMGVSKAIGQTLMGATNSLDPDNRRRIEEVSCCYMPLFGPSANVVTEIQKTLMLGQGYSFFSSQYVF